MVAVTEGAIGLLVFGCVISKLVSRRQEALVEETHRIAFEDRLDRVRTNLHLVLCDLDTILAISRSQAALPEATVRRFESTIRVFCGELQTIHDLLYRASLLPEEQPLESVLANLAVCLRELVDLLSRVDEQKHAATVESGLRAIAKLAQGICGECVPRPYARDMKQWMDQIQELSHKLV
jgi:hypothetical protein